MIGGSGTTGTVTNGGTAQMVARQMLRVERAQMVMMEG